MTRARVRVALVPPAPGSLPTGACAVALDVLRATTTLAFARRNGAARVIPFASPAEALAFRDAHPGALACGEREGRIVPGFDLGNSPGEFTRERVEGRALAFASTNGSRALLAASRCRRRLLGSFAALSAVVQALASEREIWLVCAGKLGGFSLEDAACAGFLLARLEAHGAVPAGPAARLARTLAPKDAGELRALIGGASHARELRSMGEGYARDLAFCAELDSIDRAFELPRD